MAQMRKREKTLYQRMKENRKLQSVSTILLPVIFGAVIFGAWQGKLLHTLFRTDAFTLPLPTKIATIMIDNSDKILGDTVSTVSVAAVGLLLGGILGYLIALIAAIVPKLGKGGLSITGAFASIPVVALAPVLNNWTKDVSSDAQTRSFVVCGASALSDLEEKHVCVKTRLPWGRCCFRMRNEFGKS